MIWLTSISANPWLWVALVLLTAVEVMIWLFRRAVARRVRAEKTKAALLADDVAILPASLPSKRGPCACIVATLLGVPRLRAAPDPRSLPPGVVLPLPSSFIRGLSDYLPHPPALKPDAFGNPPGTLGIVTPSTTSAGHGLGDYVSPSPPPTGMLGIKRYGEERF